MAWGSGHLDNYTVNGHEIWIHSQDTSVLRKQTLLMTEGSPLSIKFIHAYLIKRITSIIPPFHLLRFSWKKGHNPIWRGHMSSSMVIELVAQPRQSIFKVSGATFAFKANASHHQGWISAVSAVFKAQCIRIQNSPENPRILDDDKIYRVWLPLHDEVGVGAGVPSQGRKAAALKGRQSGLISSTLTTYITGLTPTIQCDSVIESVGERKFAKLQAV